jgi:hypothetical protein
MSYLSDQEKIKTAREYFMLADQGNSEVLELFHYSGPQIPDNSLRW